MDRHTVEQAIERWVQILNRRGPVAAIRKAFASDGVVLRYQAHKPEEEPVPFRGHAAIAEWVKRSPKGTTFAAVARSLRGRAPEVTVRYRVAVAEFRNGGQWAIRVEESGKITELHHRPAALPAQQRGHD